jgi:predicted nucleotide-binding protein
LAAVIGPDVQNTIQAARQEASRTRHTQTGLGHVLLAMVADAESPAGQVLIRSRITEQVVRAGMEQARSSDPAGAEVHTPADSPALQQALDHAVGRAESLGRRTVGWEDLLLAITDEGTEATRIIEAAGLRAAEVRDRTLLTLNIPVSVRPDATAPGRAGRRPATVPARKVPDAPSARKGGPDDQTADHERPRRVFVIHGRDSQALRAVREFIRELDLLTVEFGEIERLSDSVAPLVPDTVTRIFPYAQAVVALLTPDEIVSLHPDLRRDTDAEHDRGATCQSRPNVLFEIGMALGVKPNHTIIVQIGDVRPFSDIVGRSVLRLDGGDPGVLHDFKERLRKAGCPVRDSGTDWLRSDRFSHLATLDRGPDKPDA